MTDTRSSIEFGLRDTARAKVTPSRAFDHYEARIEHGRDGGYTVELRCNRCLSEPVFGPDNHVYGFVRPFVALWWHAGALPSSVPLPGALDAMSRHERTRHLDDFGCGDVAILQVRA